MVVTAVTTAELSWISGTRNNVTEWMYISLSIFLIL